MCMTEEESVGQVLRNFDSKGEITSTFHTGDTIAQAPGLPLRLPQQCQNKNFPHPNHSQTPWKPHTQNCAKKELTANRQINGTLLPKGEKEEFDREAGKIPLKTNYCPPFTYL